MNPMRPRLNVNSDYLVLLSGPFLATIDWMRFKRETNQRRGIDRGIRFIETFSAWDIAPMMNVVVEFLNGESQKNFVKQLKYIFTTPVKSEVLDVHNRFVFFSMIKQLTAVDLYACKAVPGADIAPRKPHFPRENSPEPQTQTTSNFPIGMRNNAPLQRNGGSAHQNDNTVHCNQAKSKESVASQESKPNNTEKVAEKLAKPQTTTPDWYNCNMPIGMRSNPTTRQKKRSSHQSGNTDHRIRVKQRDSVASSSHKNSALSRAKFKPSARPSAYVLVRSTPRDWTNDELIDFAAEAGTVCFVEKLREAIVKFSNSEAAQQAIQQLPMLAFHGKTFRVTEYNDENDANRSDESEDADLLCFDDIGKDATPLMPSPPPKSVSPNSESPFSVDSLRDALPKLSRSVRIENIPSNCMMTEVRDLVDSMGEVVSFTMKRYSIIGYVDAASKDKALEKLNGKLKGGKIIALEDFKPIDAEKVVEKLSESQTSIWSNLPTGWRKKGPARQNGGSSNQNSNAIGCNATKATESVASSPPPSLQSKTEISGADLELPAEFSANDRPAVYVLFRNTPRGWTIDQLEDFASEAGTVCFADKFMEAIVQFSNTEEAQKAIRLLPMHAFHDKTLRVTEYNDEDNANRSVHIENIPSDCLMIDIRELVATMGVVESFAMKHYSIVGYIDAGSKEKAFEKLKGRRNLGKIIELEEFKPIGAQKIT
ncbi:hypothetical protein DdX_15877 [Ditylenchus destructor]|uniref:RRM domain-containing protein n=1 Tax=Ditylenchus destructor TaxID=166010 RepID=A0AAD4R0I2_9BILA|nr:hypothetical protein DdX_15877 [Ditylenchus destructor]